MAPRCPRPLLSVFRASLGPIYPSGFCRQHCWTLEGLWFRHAPLAPVPLVPIPHSIPRRPPGSRDEDHSHVFPRSAARRQCSEEFCCSVGRRPPFHAISGGVGEILLPGLPAWWVLVRTGQIGTLPIA